MASNDERSNHPSSGPQFNRGPVPPEVRREILAQVAAGRKAVDVAKEYGVHYSTISDWKRQEKEAQPAEQPAPVAQEPSQTPPRETGRYSQAFKEEVLGQVRSGRPIVEVAKQYGVPDGTISRWKREAKEAGGELPAPKSTQPSTSGPSPINEEHRELVLSLKAKHPNMGPPERTQPILRRTASR